MCIAIYKLKGNDVPCEEYLKNSWEENPDGAGFAFNDNGNVRIVKGLMTWDAFKATFDKYNKQYGFKDRGLLIHFRIQTHGGVNPECTHPFPISSDEGALQKTRTVAPYAVIHNGIISLTSADAHKKEKMSDTMVFIQKYLTKIASNKKWFYNPANFELIYDLIDSKIAILNGRGDINSTYGFTKDEKDGNYYSNTTYKYGRSYYKRYYGSYVRGLYDDAWGDYEDDWVYDTATKTWSQRKNETTQDTPSVPTEYESPRSVARLQQLKPGQMVFLDDGSEYEFECDGAFFINEYGEIFWGDCPTSTWISYELLFLGCGEFWDANMKPIEFVPTHYTWESNFEFDEAGIEEDDAGEETKEKEAKSSKTDKESEVEQK